jgi:hypothetical protein
VPQAQRRLLIGKFERKKAPLVPPLPALERIDQRRSRVGVDLLGGHARGIIQLARHEHPGRCSIRCARDDVNKSLPDMDKQRRRKLDPARRFVDADKILLA